VSYWIALGAAGAIVIGSISPWATALGGIVNVNGTAGDGKITLILALVALVCLWAYWQGRVGLAAVVIVILVGLVVFGVGIYDVVNIENSVDTSEKSGLFAGVDLVDIGWGLWLVVVAGAILGFASIALSRHDRARIATRDSA